MRIVSITILLTLIYLSGLGQTATIRGKVYSRENGGVSYAGLKLTQSNKSIIADHNGFLC